MYIQIKHSIGVLILWAFPLLLMGQSVEGIEYKIQGVDLYCYVDRDLAPARIDSLLGTCDIHADSLNEYYKSGELSPGHWQVFMLTKERIGLRKPLKVLKGKPKDQSAILKAMNRSAKLVKPAPYRYGYNLFSKPAVKELDNGKTRFFLKIEGGRPRSIYLSGTFNEWSTSANPMQACDSGYFADIRLDEGGHYYKYIINGQWFLDPRNKLTDTDMEGNQNSVYFKENHRFFLKGYPEAEEVHVAGTFNDWEPDPQGFIRTVHGWERPCYLKQGTHAYKFIVDGNWILDPSNPVVRGDGMGNENSFLAVGDTFYFFLPGRLDEPQVYVSGDFNEWSPTELKMNKTDSGWVLPYVLAPGNYEYKFVMGMGYNWIMDPLNPIKNGEGSTQNSVLSVEPNKHFFYPAVPGVEEVYLSGDFNGWSENGYRMERLADGWHIDLHLPEGKWRYKFIVGDQWLRDPSNPLFEPNEFQDYNSLIWIK